MFQDLNLMVNHLKDFHDNTKKKELLEYAILAEAKHNNDTANISCRSNADKIVKNCPEIFNSFSISTSELLLMTGIPVYKILGDEKHPREEKAQEMIKYNQTSM